MIKTSTFQQALETIEALSSEEQAMLLEIIQNRLREQKRQELLKNVEQSEQDYAEGNVKRGSVSDLMKALEQCEN
ncbi:hypothetical protein [Crocosphaera chwakensis]|uniref:HigA protein (Antitoxin to HigB) n=1 Tax=Crocosphaera chwakensis CCY0110 TaxID=391612 RepID=A3IZS2_9CHRO|nr:hypothetical protein [Crocosphaera chwakensis]EAZ88015.1 hypothetical protein CY0110_13121 [Crocosphaera chwakensis CCY0110]